MWSKKGTVRGVLQPVLDEYGVGFRVMHGFASATAAYEAARYAEDQPVVALYVGDYDPSGLYMSEHHLPQRIEKYGGEDLTLQRIALLVSDLSDLPSFPASDKKGDPRYKWFVSNHGNRRWELDALDTNDRRERVEEEILDLIEPTAWERCKVVERVEQESLREIIGR